MIVKDWAEEMVHDGVEFTKPKPRLPPRKVQSSLYLEKAQEEVQAKIIAQ